jgi:hypothetical protein
VISAIIAKTDRRKSTFSPDNLCFSAQEFTEKCFSLPEWAPVVLDESREAANRKRTMANQNVTLTNFISQSRILHKFPIIILPSIYDLDKYVAEHRARLLWHVIEDWDNRSSRIRLGRYFLYGRTSIKKLFRYCSKERTYTVASHMPKQNFLHEHVIDMKRYDEMKRAAVEKFRPKQEVEPLSKEEIIKEYIAARCLALKDNLPDGVVFSRHLPAVFGITKATMYNYLKINDD